MKFFSGGGGLAGLYAKLFFVWDQLSGNQWRLQEQSFLQSQGSSFPLFPVFVLSLVTQLLSFIFSL